MNSRSHQGCLVNEGGQSDVPLGQSPTVMCAQGDLDLRWGGDKGHVQY